MNVDWPAVDRWLMGEATVGSTIPEHIHMLCDEIGVRWAGTVQEHVAARYVAEQFAQAKLTHVDVEPFDLRTASCRVAELRVPGEDGWSLDVRPCLFCPAVAVETPLVDVGYGMPHELDAVADHLAGSTALIRSEFEPFSEPVLLTLRLVDLARRGVVAAITASPHQGRRLTHISAADWRDDPTSPPLPLVQTSREDAARLRRHLSTRPIHVALHVDAEIRTIESWNAAGDVAGTELPGESVVVAAHHDTTPDSFGGNDNAAGVAVLLEAARLISQLSQHLNVRPGRTIRFISFGAEEQGLQGSAAYVERHYGPEAQPRLMIALDELATGPMKGVVLQFPELRALVQQQLTELNEGLQCHVLTQLDASGDMFPFARAGIPSSFLWRWRFVGRHPDTAYGHSSADTPEKVRMRELKDYAGFLARLLLRLSWVPQNAWPENSLDQQRIAERVEAERGAVFRTM